MDKLTPTQNKALDYIRTSIERTGIAPSLREICSFMGYKAIGSAQDLVSALRRKGFLEENDRQTARTFIPTTFARRSSARAVTPDAGDPNTYVIPCLGTVPAGNPVEAVEEHIGTLRMSIALLPKPQPRADELFALRATGESMIGAGILDGDWLVVKVEADPPKGTIVVARVESDVTVKRLARDKARGAFLQPENPRFTPVYADENPFTVVGRVVALQRALG